MFSNESIVIVSRPEKPQLETRQIDMPLQPPPQETDQPASPEETILQEQLAGAVDSVMRSCGCSGEAAHGFAARRR